MKYTVKHKGKRTSYEIKTSWKEVSFARYVQWLELFTDEERMKDNVQVLSFLSEIPVDVLSKFPITIVLDIAEVTRFMYDFEGLTPFNIVPEAFSKLQVAQMPWGLYERAKMAIENHNGHYFGSGAEVIRIYLGEARKVLREKIAAAKHIANPTAEELDSLARMISEEEEYAIVDRIDQLPITQVIGLVNFFFHNFGLLKSASRV